MFDLEWRARYFMIIFAIYEITNIVSKFVTFFLLLQCLAWLNHLLLTKSLILRLLSNELLIWVNKFAVFSSAFLIILAKILLILLSILTRKIWFWKLWVSTYYFRWNIYRHRLGHRICHMSKIALISKFATFRRQEIFAGSFWLETLRLFSSASSWRLASSVRVCVSSSKSTTTVHFNEYLILIYLSLS